jgi:hypothetical protein
MPRAEDTARKEGNDDKEENQEQKLGVILFLTGAQLALGACDIPKDKGERFVLVVTGALAVWNVGIAFVVGIAGYWLNKKGWFRI